MKELKVFLSAYFLTLAVLLSGTLVLAQEAPKPAAVVFSDPVAPPSPPIPAGRPVTLNQGEYYVIRSNLECKVVASPEGIVTITQEAGPIKVHAIFTDTGKRYVTRTFTEKNVWLVNYAAPGKCEIIVVPDKGDIIRRTIVTGDAPDPGPKPDPTPKDKIAPEDLRVMVVWETSTINKLPNDQASMKTDPILLSYMKSKGQYNLVFLDKDATFADQPESKQWKDALAKRPSDIPCVVIFDGRNGNVAYAGPLPANATELVSKAKKAVGE